MHKARAFFVVCAGLSLLAFRAVLAAPLPMLPLEVGNHWDYIGASGAHQVETITGTQTVLGRTVFVKSYAEGLDAGLENFWLTGPSGEVLLAGFNSPGFGYALAYDPPITICGNAPSVGDTWTTHTTVYNLADMSVFTVLDITFGALEAVSLSVPAGTFPCIGVGQVPFAASPASPAWPAAGWHWMVVRLLARSPPRGPTPATGTRRASATCSTSPATRSGSRGTAVPRPRSPSPSGSSRRSTHHQPGGSSGPNVHRGEPRDGGVLGGRLDAVLARVCGDRCSLVVAAWQTSTRLGVLTLIMPFYAVSTGNWRLKTEKRVVLAIAWWTCFIFFIVVSIIPR